MKFFFTLRLASRSGRPTQAVLGHHPAADLDSLLEELNAHPFILVDTFIVDDAGAEKPSGQTIIAGKVIAKVRDYRPPRPRGPFLPIGEE